MYATHQATFPEGPLGLVLGCREDDSAAIVVSIKAGGAAERGGVREGDVVARIGGRRVGDYDAVLEMMRAVGRPVKIDFERETDQAAPRAAEEKLAAEEKAKKPSSKTFQKPPKKAPAPAIPPKSKKVVPPPPPPPASRKDEGSDDDDDEKAASRGGWLSQKESAESRGNIAKRWEALRQQHVERQEARLASVRQELREDVEERTKDLERDHVAKKVKYFDAMFAEALQTAMKESAVMAEKDREKARAERARRRRELEEQAAADAEARRAAKPSIENVAAHPDELRIGIAKPPPGMKLVYALVDVSHLEGEKKLGLHEDARRAKMAQLRPAASLVSEEESSEARLAEKTHTWHAYDGPLVIEEPGTYAVLTKAVPVDRDAAAKFVAAAEREERTKNAPPGYADYASVLVDAAQCGILKKKQAYEMLEAARLREDVRDDATRLADRVEAIDPARAEARRLRMQRIADIRAAALSFEQAAAAEGNEDDVVASSGSAVIITSSARADHQKRRLAGEITFDNFADACAADETKPEFDEAKTAESQVSSAVYALSYSPPVLWHEDYDRELKLVENDPTKRCYKCGGTDKLYAHGDFVICRTCALEGAGILVDPGARRMWFSQMIQFFPSREIPLPKSHPLLEQILRVLRSNPGIAVRFEGHVNSACGLDCDGTKACHSKMCQKVPGGALGLSTARAESVKSFILACGIEADRVYAQGFAGTRRISNALDEASGHVNRRVEVHTLLC
ncbi:hypothetical protein CTAYLR_002346 [Chrysophaeum taylorii]|uniref:PDZ domain-containing protein n=1 Tax=Chrysophaeum taylorii TaxID=2483200 RepID=A0AAD7UGC3_9STRA|nr:hypothetical protein CTAYLR_002346 [Chrysophaeum taylorii]